MQEAAHEMSRAVGSIESALHNHQIFMSQWLLDYEHLLDKQKGL